MFLSCSAAGGGRLALRVAPEEGVGGQSKVLRREIQREIIRSSWLWSTRSTGAMVAVEARGGARSWYVVRLVMMV